MGIYDMSKLFFSKDLISKGIILIINFYKVKMKIESYFCSFFLLDNIVLFAYKS